MLGRRGFLGALGRAGTGALIAAAVPEWARAASRLATAPGARAGRAALDADLIVRNTWPEHYETSIAALGRAWVTPTQAFFVRSHFPVPDVDPESYRLEVTGLVRTPLTLTLPELLALPAEARTLTLECAGNGRGLFSVPSTSGTQWERGAVGNAAWRGPLLASLLRRAEVQPEAKHVWLEAADRAPLPDAVPPFLRSIPLEKALDDVILAHSMNGAAIPKLHGAPLRAIVPGWFGMASTKWVTRIRVEAAPSDNHFFIRGYRYVHPGEDPTKAAPVQEMRVKSLITRPREGARVARGQVSVRGFAWAGPAGVERVEISSDDGTSWSAARFVGEDAPGAWRSWEAQLEAKGAGSRSVMARATDRNGEAQPLKAEANASGYGNNSVHRVAFRVV
jgi:DMSO/TMAO reductase YedYZ molybdopterin-dependent catalytic subunit